jgi:hypothetical protein
LATELSADELAFLLSDIAEAKKTLIKETNWEALGPASGEIKKTIADQNINLKDPEVSVTIRAINYDENTLAVVDVASGGGGEAPDPFRYVYFVRNGKYVGYAGSTAS